MIYMGILKGLFRSRDKSKNSTAGSAYRFFLGGSTAGKNVNERSAMQMTAVYSCVRILSEAVAGLPLYLYKYTDNGSKKKALDHSLYFLLHDEPNPEITSFAFRETLMTHLLLWGNAYAQIIRNGKNEIVGLYPLMSNRMTVDRDEKGQLYYEYQTSTDEARTTKGGTVRLRPTDVLHIPGLGFDGLVGYSPIAMAKNAIGLAIAAEEYGRLVLKQYGNKAVWTVPQKERFDSSYSDFVTGYTAVSSTNMITQTSEYIFMETDDALTMYLGVNPLMQFGLKSIREKMLREILTALQKVSYVPFDSSTIENPALEPGDVLKFTGGHANDGKISCITSVEYKINGKQTLKCVGKNPRLANAKSKNDKNITGLINSIESGKTVIYNFVNVSPFVIGQSLTKIMDIDFTATEETSASFQCEMLLEVLKPESVTEDNPELSIVYKINDETIDNFMPTKTCLYGKHIVTLFFPISKVIDNSSNPFSVYLKTSSGTVSIGEAQIRATISGQGLAAGLGDWNGRISINENIGFIQLSGVPFMADAFNDRMSVVFPDRKNQSVNQSIENIPIP